MSDVALPELTGVRRVFDAFASAGITAAVGGSAVLAAHGLVDVVRDWDITTDADPDVVRAALDAADIAYTTVPRPDASYRSREYLAVIDAPVEIIVGYAIGTPDGDVPIPTVVNGEWHGFPLSDPAPWVLAYRVMGRVERSELLHRATTPDADTPNP